MTKLGALIQGPLHVSGEGVAKCLDICFGVLFWNFEFRTHEHPKELCPKLGSAFTSLLVAGTLTSTILVTGAGCLATGVSLSTGLLPATNPWVCVCVCVNPPNLPHSTPSFLCTSTSRFCAPLNLGISVMCKTHGVLYPLLAEDYGREKHEPYVRWNYVLGFYFKKVLRMLSGSLFLAI